MTIGSRWQAGGQGLMMMVRSASDWRTVICIRVSCLRRLDHKQKLFKYSVRKDLVARTEKTLGLETVPSKLRHS